MDYLLHTEEPIPKPVHLKKRQSASKWKRNKTYVSETSLPDFPKWESPQALSWQILKAQTAEHNSGITTYQRPGLTHRVLSGLSVHTREARQSKLSTCPSDCSGCDRGQAVHGDGSHHGHKLQLIAQGHTHNVKDSPHRRDQARPKRRLSVS